MREHLHISLLTDKSAADNMNERLVILRWKGNNTTGRVAHSARCVSVPVWKPELLGADHHYLPMLQEAVYEQQKAMIHATVSSFLDNGEDCQSLPLCDFSPSMVLAAWESENDSSGNERGRGKLSKEGISEWFNHNMRDLLILTLGNKQGLMDEGAEPTEADLLKLEASANGYSKVMQLLATPKPNIEVKTAQMLLKALELLPEEKRKVDAVYGKLTKKVDGIINPVRATENLLEAL